MPIEIRRPVFDGELEGRELRENEGESICRCTSTAREIGRCLSNTGRRTSEFPHQEMTELLLGQQKTGNCAIEALRRANERGAIHCKCRGDLSQVLDCLQVAEQLQTTRIPGISVENHYAKTDLGAAIGKCANEALKSISISTATPQGKTSTCHQN